MIEVTLKNETSGEILAKGVSSLVAGNDYWQKSGCEAIGFDLNY